MSLKIHPDPREPTGGYAFLEIPGGSLSGERAGVAVLEVFGGRWLAPSEAEDARIGVGNPNWQSERFEFGPYEIRRHDDADWLRIGPEIVNKIEEYTPLRISVGPVTQDVTWPDDIPPRAGAAVLGGIRATARTAGGGDEAARLVGRMMAGEPDEEDPGEASPGAEAESVQAEAAADPAAPAPTRLIVPAVIVAVLIAAALAWYFLNSTDEPAGSEAAEAPAAAAETVPAPGAAVDARCGLTALAALAALAGGFAETGAAIRACGSAVSPETALRLIEDGAAAKDAEALLLFGTLYDGDELDPRIENLIGLSFADDPARAAEYYARAVQAGSEAARARLAAVCARLSGASATLARGAFDDFCD